MLFALPWINQVRAFTLLFSVLGIVVLLTPGTLKYFKGYFKQPLFILLFAYYLFQLIVFFAYPGNSYAYGDVERKVSLVVVPVVFTLACSGISGLWQVGIAGLACGVTAGAVACLAAAVVKYQHLHDSSVFFYHEYAGATGLSAIYLSLYILIVLGYIVTNPFAFKPVKLVHACGVFLYCSLLLLSSKILIVAGTVLLVIPMVMGAVKRRYSVALLAVAVGTLLVVAITDNPIKKRYADIDTRNYTVALHSTDFQNYHFDGLSIRLLMWRMGYNLISTRNLWLFGAGGERYHSLIQQPMDGYRLYKGDGSPGNTGYREYNMHNQYMETFVQFGLVGLALLLAIMGYIIAGAFSRGNSFLAYTGILVAITFLTESMLETQAGLLLFVIVISGEWISKLKGTALQAGKLPFMPLIFEPNKPLS